MRKVERIIKLIKIALMVCLSLVTVFGLQSSNVKASGSTTRSQEIMAGGGGSSPYLNRKWIYVTSIKSSSIQINNANAITSAVTGFVLGFVPYAGTIFAGLGVIRQYINQRKA